MSANHDPSVASAVTVESLCPKTLLDVGNGEGSLIMPAEWTPHQACLILFPHNPQTFRLEPAQKEVLNVARAIAMQGNETVYLLVKDKSTIETHFKGWNEESSHIKVRVCPSDDTWVRDTGPTCCFLKTKPEENPTTTLVGINWEFNAYGGPEEGCYWPCELDRKVASRVCKDVLQIPLISIPMILEGGSIHTDGEGTLLVTKECLLNKNRNPQLQQDIIEGVLKRVLGVGVVIWLPNGLDADEDTNGHVDNFCCFTEPGHVVLAWTDDEVNDLANYQRCRTALETLSSVKDAKGRNLQAHKLRLPSPPLRYTKEEAESLKGSDPAAVARQPDEKMAASYVNFYIANDAVVVPQYGVNTTDAQAISVLQERFPGRTVVGVQSREILLGGGNIHCITQQIPVVSPIQ
jgi:agmatine deiminase